MGVFFCIVTKGLLVYVFHLNTKKLKTMTNTPSVKNKIPKIFTIIGIVLLIVMGAFHGSGINYVNGLITESNADDLLKAIVPVLFAHPSIHLIGMAGMGVLTFFMKHEQGKVLFAIGLFILVDAALAFYLGGILPGVLLSSAALSFIFAGIKSQ